jgi:hypothetical protein
MRTALRLGVAKDRGRFCERQPLPTPKRLGIFARVTKKATDGFESHENAHHREHKVHRVFLFLLCIDLWLIFS